MRVSGAAKYLGGMILAAALLWWVLRGVDPGLVRRQRLGVGIVHVENLCEDLRLGRGADGEDEHEEKRKEEAEAFEGQVGTLSRLGT